MVSRPIAVIFVAFMTGALGGCASDVNPVRDLFVSAGAGPGVVTRPDFVEASRPANVGYMPVGVSAPVRPVPKKTAEEVKKMEAELGATRAAHEARAAEARRLSTSPPPEPPRVAPIPPVQPGLEGPKRP